MGWVLLLLPLLFVLCFVLFFLFKKTYLFCEQHTSCGIPLFKAPLHFVLFSLKTSDISDFLIHSQIYLTQPLLLFLIPLFPISTYSSIFPSCSFSIICLLLFHFITFSLSWKTTGSHKAVPCTLTLVNYSPVPLCACHSTTWMNLGPPVFSLSTCILPLIYYPFIKCVSVTHPLLVSQLSYALLTKHSKHKVLKASTCMLENMQQLSFGYG